MKKNTILILTLSLCYILLSFLSVVNGIVIPSYDVIPPFVSEIVYRLIIVALWYFVAIFLMLKIKRTVISLLVLIPPICVSFLHCAGYVYLTTEPQNIMKDGVMTFAVIEFCAGVILTVFLLVVFCIKTVGRVTRGR